MTTSSRSKTKHQARPHWRAVALPTEHGGWGFLLEPLLLANLVAWTLPGLLLSIATVAAFLVRQPLKAVLIDRRRGQETARTRLARRFTALYGVVALVGLAGALGLAGPWFLAALAVGLPFAAIFAYYDWSQPGRTLQAELTAPLALATVASALAVMAGWAWPPALALWGILAARIIPSIFYVRSRIRLDKGKPASVYGPVLLHLAALVAVYALVAQAIAPPLATVAFTILLLRAAVMLGPRRPQVTVKVIGFSELFFGIATVMIVALGYWQM